MEYLNNAMNGASGNGNNNGANPQNADVNIQNQGNMPSNNSGGGFNLGDTINGALGGGQKGEQNEGEFR